MDVKEILSQLDPEERERISNDWAEVLSKMAAEEPNELDIMLTKMADVMSPEQLSETINRLSAIAKKKQQQNNNKPSQN